MSTSAIKVENISKKYILSHQSKRGQGSLRDLLTDSAKSIAKTLTRTKVEDPNHEEFWAIKDVSFDIKQGDRVGIIGRNGAGKSTLLKILSRITEPTQGRVSIRGRFASLLEVGTGFHQELSGRENIFLNGAILGMSKKEIQQKFDQIVDFAEVEKFLDTPVKRYSSGMYVRLAFSVAAHLEPEILIVDEVLAVGDVEFQKKCLGRMKEVGNDGRTVLFVSHNMGAIEALCDSSIVLSKGGIIYKGSVKDGIQHYMNSLQSETGLTDFDDMQNREGDGSLRFTGFNMIGDYVVENTVTFGKHVRFEIPYTAETALKNIHMTLGVYDQYHQELAWFSNELVGDFFDSINKTGKFVCEIDKFPFMPGQYYLNIHCRVGGNVADFIKVVRRIDVVAGDFYGTGRLPHWGSVTIPHKWSAS